MWVVVLWCMWCGAGVAAHAGVVQNQAVIYLDYQVNTCRNRDAAIHNYLLSLLAKQDHDDDLLAFILRQTAGVRLCLP